MNVPVLLQTDRRWNRQRLGTNNAATIGGYGCAITCVTMANQYYGGGEGLVDRIDDIFTNEGGYVDDAGHRSPQMGCSMLDWSRIHTCLPHTSQASEGFYSNGPADLGRIKASIAAGDPVILEVRWEGHPNLMHFVLAVGYHLNDIIVNCPERGRVAFSSKLYGTGDAATDIFNAHFLTGTKPQPTQPISNPASAPATPEVSQVTQAQAEAMVEAAVAPLNQKISELTMQLGSQQSQDKQTIANQAAVIKSLNATLEAHVPEYVRTYVAGEPTEVLSTREFTVQDFAGQYDAVVVPVNTILDVQGQFTVNGKAYWRTQKSVAGGYYFGVPVAFVNPYRPANPVRQAGVIDASAMTGTGPLPSQSVPPAGGSGLSLLSKLFGGK